MEDKWNPKGFQFSCVMALILGLQIQGSLSLNDEGIVLLEFRRRLFSDPCNVFDNWNPNDVDPCDWYGVRCVYGKVHALDLNGLSLEGTLSPELGKLIDLRSLMLCNNRLSGPIPKEIGELSKLELLDLRENNFSGTIPAEIGSSSSLRQLLLCGNDFEGKIQPETGRLTLHDQLQFKQNALTSEISCTSRKFRHRLKLGRDSNHDCEDSCCNKAASSSMPPVSDLVSRRILIEQSSHNLEALPASSGSAVQIIALPSTRSSGSFVAVPNTKKNQSHSPVSETPPSIPTPDSPSDSSGASVQSHKKGSKWMYFLIIPVMLMLAVVGLVVMCRKRGMTTIGPWKTGLSGQLQKAFVTGVPKLNRAELETACEDFSNIIGTINGCTMYKGTLSSGVEIAVASTSFTCLKDWSKTSEMNYRKKIDTLSRINHKNFVNLLGFCEEDEPFNRMMVFEYAPNGTLFEHLHVKEMEHLDWTARMRIIMGTAYCLQYMHGLSPPLSHTNLTSRNIYLTDDYAAKIAEICFSHENATRINASGNDGSEHSAMPTQHDPETNVYAFGILLLEIISGKLQYSEEQGPLEKWAAQYLSDIRSISYMIDPTLKSFKNNELDVICEVIQDCIQIDPRKRPTMKDVTSKLRGVIGISPDQATPRLSPLWWAELEILSSEAT